MTKQKNNRLLILSHNAHKYAKLIADAGVPDLQITPTVTVEKARAFAKNLSGPLGQDKNVLSLSYTFIFKYS